MARKVTEEPVKHLTKLLDQARTWLEHSYNCRSSYGDRDEDKCNCGLTKFLAQI